MSFVLEALKKQEAGSDPAAAVSLARVAEQRRRHRLWMALFGVAMAGNAALAAWVLLDRPEQSEPAGIAAGTSSPRAATQRPQRVAERPAAEGRAAETPPAAQPAAGGPAAAAMPPTPVAAAPAPARAAPTRLQRLRLNELPEADRARFPGLAFSTHIYAEDADLRAVVANGRRLSEGDRIRGLELVEITESGAVFQFEHYLVEVPMATDWDAL